MGKKLESRKFQVPASHHCQLRSQQRSRPPSKRNSPLCCQLSIYSSRGRIRSPARDHALSQQAEQLVLVRAYPRSSEKCRRICTSDIALTHERHPQRRVQSIAISRPTRPLECDTWAMLGMDRSSLAQKLSSPPLRPPEL